VYCRLHIQIMEYLESEFVCFTEIDKYLYQLYNVLNTQLIQLLHNVKVALSFQIN